MKKIFIIIISLLIISFLFKDEKTKTVFIESIEGEQKYQVIFENKEITTNNFTKYFFNYKIESIYPYINPIYKNKLLSIEKYTFDYTSIDSNLNKFKEKYISLLELKGYKQEAIKAKIGGIIIEKVELYMDLEQLKELQKWLPNLKYITL